MQRWLSIGEFSKVTHLPVKTLRHYHEVGVVVPAAIDPASGYRRYGTDQVGSAHLVRRLRNLDMPLAEVRTVIEAPEEQARNRAILSYLARMERQLAQAQLAVASLRALLEAPTDSLVVEYRLTPTQPAVARRAVVEGAAVSEWCAATYPLLYAAIAEGGAVPAGIGGALYPSEFFEKGVGEVIAFVPTADRLAVAEDSRDASRHGLVEAIDIPGTNLAVALHCGSFDELDRTYGSLGTYVAARSLAGPGPIREYYLVTPDETDDPDELRTEVAWPIRPRSEDQTQPNTKGAMT
jgi:DNA-binding transcriptional MerR regulator/effector-binding domain-containing protein